MMKTSAAALGLCGLWYAISAAVAAQGTVSAASAQTAVYQLGGVVTDSGHAPIAEAEVTLLEVGAVVRQVATDAAGWFTLGDLPARRFTLRVHRLGYRQQIRDVLPGADGTSTFVEIILADLPAELAGLVVTPRASPRLREFAERRERRRGFARFLDDADIRRLAPASASDLFRSVPGITIRAASSGGNTIRIRGCQPTVWVDGQRIPGAELDDVIRPNDIGGIEFYPSSAGIPPQYMDPSNRLCGLILVWTKMQ